MLIPTKVDKRVPLSVQQYISNHITLIFNAVSLLRYGFIETVSENSGQVHQLTYQGAIIVVIHSTTNVILSQVRLEDLQQKRTHMQRLSVRYIVEKVHAGTCW